MQANQIAFPCGRMPFQESRKWGYLDKSNRIAIAPSFDYATGFAGCGLAAVKTGAKWGYIKEDGSYAIEPAFDYAFKFSGGIAHVVQNGKDQYIDPAGNRLPAPQQGEGSSPLGLKKFDADGKTGCTDQKGKILIPPVFDEVWVQSEGLPVMVGLGNKKGYVDLTGGFVIPPDYAYDDAMPFVACGLAQVRQDGKWGFIGPKGQFVLEPQFDRTYGYSDGFFLVMAEGKWGYVNSQGELAIPLQYSGGALFANGYAAVSKNRKYGFIDHAGNMVAPFLYDDASSFQNGLAAVLKDGKCGYLDTSGQVAISFEFENAGGFSKDGYAVVQSERGLGVICKDGDWVIDPHRSGLLANDFFELDED